MYTFVHLFLDFEHMGKRVLGNAYLTFELYMNTIAIPPYTKILINCLYLAKVSNKTHVGLVLNSGDGNGRKYFNFDITIHISNCRNFFLMHKEIVSVTVNVLNMDNTVA